MRQGQKSELGVLAEQVTRAGELGRHAELQSCPGCGVRLPGIYPHLSPGVSWVDAAPRAICPSLPHCSARERVLG